MVPPRFHVNSVSRLDTEGALVPVTGHTEATERNSVTFQILIGFTINETSSYVEGRTQLIYDTRPNVNGEAQLLGLV